MVMMKQPVLFLLVASLLCASVARAQQRAPQLEAFIKTQERNYVGFKRLSAKLEMTMEGTAMTGTQLFDLDQGQRMEFLIEGTTVLLVSNPEGAWQKIGDMPATEMDSLEAAEMQYQIRQARPDIWASMVSGQAWYIEDSDSLGPKAHVFGFLPTEEQQRMLAAKPETQDFTYSNWRLWVETGTYNPIGMTFDVGQGSRTALGTILLSNWQQVDGYPFPHTFQVLVDIGLGSPSTVIEMNYTSLEINGPIPPDTFTKPE